MAACGLRRENAKTLFTLVKATGLENTQVVLTGTTPGRRGSESGEPVGPQTASIYPPWFERGDNYQQPQRKKRRGLFGRRWFQATVRRAITCRAGNYYRGLGPRGY